MGLVREQVSGTFYNRLIFLVQKACYTQFAFRPLIKKWLVMNSEVMFIYNVRSLIFGTEHLQRKAYKIQDQENGHDHRYRSCSGVCRGTNGYPFCGHADVFGSAI
jgi:hypothetical protein